MVADGRRVAADGQGAAGRGHAAGAAMGGRRARVRAGSPAQRRLSADATRVCRWGTGARGPADRARLAGASAATRRMSLLTLLFLGVAGLRRTWDLRGYVGDGLALLTGRRRAYSYRSAERFLSEVAAHGGADALTDALGTWTTRLWHPGRPGRGDAPPSFYIDGHRKAVYTAELIPRGLVARRGA